MNLQHEMKPRALCRVCGSKLDRRIATRGRHWNCELTEWMVRCDERDRTDVGSKHLISSRARWQHCGCGELVIAALAEGIPTAVDPAVVGPVEELNALVAGRRSFDMVTISGRTEIVHRDQSRQKMRLDPVVIEHLCPHRVQVADPLDVVKERVAQQFKTGGKSS